MEAMTSGSPICLWVLEPVRREKYESNVYIIPYIKKRLLNITKDEVQLCCEDRGLREIYLIDHCKDSPL